MASINQACGRMVARRTGTRRTPVSARMLTASALGGANNYSPLRPTAAPRRAGQTHPPSPPRTRGVRGGRQVVHPCGPHLHAPVCACCRRRTSCTRHPTNVSRLAAHSPQHSRPRAFRPRRARARRRTNAGAGRLSMMNPSPVATLPRRSRESRPSHQRADGGDDGRARR
jgi:hypothetical protein